MARIVVVLPGTSELIQTSRELLNAANRLRTDGDSIAVLWFNGPLSEQVRAELGTYRVDSVHPVELPLDLPRGVAGSRAVLSLNPTWVVLRSHPDATENTALLGRAMNSAAIVEANGLTVGPDGVRVHKAAFGSTWNVTVKVSTDGAALAFRPNSFPVTAPLTSDEATAPVVEPIDEALFDTMRSEPVAKVTSRVVEPSSGRPDLETAQVVVVGGRGTESDFSELEELADELDGAVGATRDVTDLGWAPLETMVGQTGVTIAPALYIGAGVSGAIHHVIGMRGAGTIVAINNDPDAAIFDLADVGVVGDMHSVIPALTEEIRARKAARAPRP